MEPRARVTWLFVRGEETIRVNRSADGLSLTANGPGHGRQVFRFADDATADEFLKLYEHYLTGAGWTLEAFVERRSSEGPRPVGRPGSDRRRGPDAGS